MDPCCRQRKGVASKRAFWVVAASTVVLVLGSVALAEQERATDADPSLSADEPTDTVTLKRAREAALARNPELHAFSAEVRAQGALARQAGLRPNPGVRTEIENVGGSGNRQGFESTETTLVISQLIELGGKRPRRVRLAALGTELATWEYEAKRRDVLARTTKAFVGVLVAQERLALAKNLERVAGDGVSAVARAVTAGGLPPVETTRARVTLGRAALERSRAEMELAIGRTTLAATWGTREARFIAVEGDLTRVPWLPPEGRFLDALRDSPDLARWATERTQRAASLELEEARIVPDVTVGAGGRHFSDNSDNALVFELSVPLPTFDRNQGNVAAARHRVAKAESENVAADVIAHAAVREAYQRLSGASERAQVLRTTILPDARAARAGIQDAFRSGLLRPLDVLEAQRTLFELEGEYVSALEAAHLAAADLERLTAIPLNDLSGDDHE